MNQFSSYVCAVVTIALAITAPILAPILTPTPIASTVNGEAPTRSAVLQNLTTSAQNSSSAYLRQSDRNTSEAVSYIEDLSFSDQEDLVSRTYLPVLRHTAIPTKRLVNLTLEGLELTQAVQTLSNTVPLVAGRPTMARLYATSNLSDTPVAGALIEASRDGVPLPGSPIHISAAAIPISTTRADLVSSFNAVLPPEWLHDAVVLTATIDPDQLVPEPDETDNSITLTFTFQSVPPLKIILVPILYTDEPTGQVYPPPETDPITDWIMRSYPLSEIDADLHTPLAFAGNLGQSADWLTLLSNLSDLKASEGLHDATVYYGLIPTENAQTRWFNGGIAGLGWVGYRASIGLQLPSGWGTDRSGQVAAHEIGHNFGQWHAPCGNPAGADTSYPYSNGSIGQFGLDLVALKTYQPSQTSDLMSYCNPQWVSDYTYEALYRDQREHGAFQYELPSPKLIVRFRFGASGLATLQPVYAVTTNHTSPAETDDYAVELVDAGGQVIGHHPVAAWSAVADNISLEAGFAQIPMPEAIMPGTILRLMHGATILDQRALQPVTHHHEPLAPQVKHNGDRVEVMWGHAGHPALVRYSADAGMTWTTVGIDITAGELMLAAASLPDDPEGQLQFEVRLGD